MKKKLGTLTVRGEIKDGVLKIGSSRYLKGMIQQFEDCKVNVTLARQQKSKSKEQLGYLWGVVYPEISTHTGHTPEELHDIFKTKFLTSKRMWRGAEMVIVGSTQTLSVGEMAEFMASVQLEANELGIEIPEPDKAYQFK